MELTMLTRVCMSQSIRALMKDLPSDLDIVQDSFVKAFESDQRGTLPNEIGSYHDQTFTFPNSTKSKSLTDELYTLLQRRYPRALPSRRALLQPSIKYRRATYSTSDTSEANSYVVIGNYPHGDWNAAQITDIIIQQSGSNSSEPAYRSAIAVRLFIKLSDEDAAKDFYRAQNRESGVGQLFYKRPLVAKTLVQVEDLVCHFSRNPIPKVPGIGKDCIHVRPLYRVSLLPFNIQRWGRTITLTSIDRIALEDEEYYV